MVQIEQDQMGVTIHLLPILCYLLVLHKHDVHICNVIQIVVIETENNSFVSYMVRDWMNSLPYFWLY